jgi:hypothetical protein
MPVFSAFAVSQLGYWKKVDYSTGWVLGVKAVYFHQPEVVRLSQRTRGLSLGTT